ncbi:probable S-acyltransferase 16 [Olea europaea subsp. europaea]|uniref:Probable S-acyltransferase 16 n=1 Tax=Olea europaea subsp. europaea TaxID=158383 RepID=A0A8S0UV71_OLEEU|nr:probable S-acyltransferase 16 [Olea europaea subsp. europaea]
MQSSHVYTLWFCFSVVNLLLKTILKAFKNRIISGLFLIPVSLVLSIFLGWHIHLMLQNKTTIEYCEGVRAMPLAEGCHLYTNPYDIGAHENVTSILGPNYLCWVSPTSGNVSSGLRFSTKYHKANEN